MKNTAETIKKKIFTIKKIAKITKAMKIISAMNFKKNFSHIKNTDLCQELTKDIFGKLYFLLLNSNFVQKKNFKTKTVKNKVLWIVFGSDLGLCGSFNTKIVDLISKKANKNDSLCIIGRRLFNYFVNETAFSIWKNYLISDFHIFNLDKVINFLINENSFTDIKLVYSEYQSHFKINVTIKELLPVSTEELKNKEEILSRYILEETPKIIFQDTVFLYCKNLLLIAYWHSRTSEEKTRQISMENASENSRDIMDKLKLKYNQFRQEKITKEILLISQEDY